jgi:multiple sugar transport system ATP-binding protein
MKLGSTFLSVTQDQVEAMSIGDRIGVLNQGHIIQVGTPQQIYNRPRDTFVAAFVGSPTMNLHQAGIAGGRAVIVPGRLEVPLAGLEGNRAAKLPATVTLGVRSEDVVVGPNETVEARVHGVENQGVEKVVTLRVDDCLLKATVPARLEIEVDAAVRFSFKQEKLHFFDVGSGINLFYGEESDNG